MSLACNSYMDCMCSVYVVLRYLSVHTVHMHDELR